MSDSEPPYVMPPGNPDSEPDPKSSPTPTPKVTPTPIPSGNETVQQRVLELTNQYRAANGASPLTRNALLEKAAFAHAMDMGTRGYFSHYSPNGAGPGTRIDQAGYEARTWGENIAYGYKTADAVMTGWMNSSGHRANILNKSFRELGVGYFVNQAGTAYWVQNFGAQ